MKMNIFYLVGKDLETVKQVFDKFVNDDNFLYFGQEEVYQIRKIEDVKNIENVVLEAWKRLTKTSKTMDDPNSTIPQFKESWNHNNFYYSVLKIILGSLRFNGIFLELTIEVIDYFPPKTFIDLNNGRVYKEFFRYYGNDSVSIHIAKKNCFPHSMVSFKSISKNLDIFWQFINRFKPEDRGNIDDIKIWEIERLMRIPQK